MFAPDEAAVVDAARACAQAEFAQWQAVLTFREQRVAELDRDESLTSMYRRMAVNAIALDLAQLLHISEQQVWRIVEQGRCLRDQIPSAWTAFAAGRVGASKAAIIASAVDRTKKPETVQALDAVVIDYAVAHTPAELRKWIDKLIDRLEPIDIDQADRERAQRHVRIDHTYHGMSYLNAYIPTPAAVAIGSRLRKAARQLDDERTQAQKEADLVCSWLTNATGTECDIKAEIAVVVEAEALAGVTDVPAQVNDEASIPIQWVFGLTDSGSMLWTRLLTDPMGRVLDVTHLGYQPPEALRAAVQWRDMTCRVSGCNKRAEFTDLDHIKPFDAGGPTSGSNLRCLCRRHHGMKGHGLLPSNCYEPPTIHVVRLPSRPLRMEYIAAA